MIPRTRAAFTLVELLVVIAIIGLVVGLLLPAVQAAREAARRVSCQNNLRQLAIAIHNYESVHRGLPPGRGAPLPRIFSVFPYLLPFCEQSSLYQQIDFSQAPTDFNIGAAIYSGAVNAAMANTPLPFLLCPSDGSGPRIAGLQTGATSYAGNAGSGLRDYGTLTKADGLFYLDSHTRFAEVTDGLSNVVAVAERTLGTGNAGSSAGRTMALRVMFELPSGQEPSELQCRSADSIGAANAFRGGKWLLGNYGNTLYNHFSPPNSFAVDCMNVQQQKGQLAARSLHTGGALVALCDSSIRFIENGIEIGVWRALGTRDGGEVVAGY